MVRRPSCTAVSRSGNIVSSPGNPGGAFSPDLFSSTVCGAKGVTSGHHCTEQNYKNVDSGL